MHLTKHHGLGNDFLVLVDLAEAHPIDADIARAVCDRHRGVGADGLIRVTRGDGNPFRMELRNEDGSRAELSGNGISCLAQALLLAGATASDHIGVDTDAGPRTVHVDHVDAGTHRMTVEMGTPSVGDELDEWVDDVIIRAVSVDVGNPHVVCHVADPDRAPDLARFGKQVHDSVPGGANVELIHARAGGGLSMEVYERGVGPTMACGTGAVAAATAAHRWGLASATVEVHQPGGPATVTVGDPARLTVPVVAIATIEWRPPAVVKGAFPATA